jgi:2-oxoglutarate dehydrogenase complex dehydrogenase (E1) component-like enzyme
VLLCSGKIYYDLLQKQTKDIAVIRLEQLYPFPKQTLLTILSRYPQTAQIVWVQEEPQNMGVWNYLLGIWTQHLFPQKLHYLGKTIASAPAVGSHKWHEMEQQTLIQTAFSENIPFFKGEEFL